MFLIIHLFNIGGQLVLHQYLAYQSDKLFNEEISKNHYNTGDLTELRIPVNMPGITDWKDYENLKGQIRFANSSYNYVKMKLTRNAIYLMCVPNYETTHLYNQNIINAGQIKDIPVPKKEHVPFGKINLATYNCQIVHYRFSAPILTFKKNIFSYHSVIPKSFISGPCQPPDAEMLIS
jgi:hypothetical protein